ncbi:MAG: hypothetical protein BWY70_01358 [Bacteroidetes bacterium ADurb.Bin408]|nr:MAG: hypothetical protein BWY70_01358 [Bacteroidetes bacterium ADurb.Bin408]
MVNYVLSLVNAKMFAKHIFIGFEFMFCHLVDDTFKSHLRFIIEQFIFKPVRVDEPVYLHKNDYQHS